MKNKIINIILIILFISIGITIFLLINNKEDTIDTIDNHEISFNILNSKIEMTINETKKIAYTKEDQVTITWESLDKEIAQVDNNGNITALKIGNTTIIATANKNGKQKKEMCFINVYQGNKNIKLEKIDIPDGELIISKNNSYTIPLNIVPEDAYITSINYNTNNYYLTNKDNTISSINSGTTTFKITINNEYEKEIKINIIDKNIDTQFIQLIDKIEINEKNINLKVNEKKKLEYTIFPNNAYIDNINWESSNKDIVEVNENGEISAKKAGNCKIKLTINDNFLKNQKFITEYNINVKTPIENLKLISSKKRVLKIGDKEKIYVDITPSTSSDQKLIYTSSNPKILTVSNNGEVQALKEGKVTVTIKTEDNSHTLTKKYCINPRNGILNEDACIFQYDEDDIKIPQRGDTNFFANIVKQKKGTLNGNTYTYIKGNTTYTYDIQNSILYINSDPILMRFYYPENTDLSTVNTLTFLGGIGEVNFNGYYKDIDKDTSKIKSSGIIILISTQSSSKGYNANLVIEATKFINLITEQKKGAINSVAGYSMGGPEAGNAANIGNYQRLLIFDSYFNSPATLDNIKNKEIIFYSPSSDDMRQKTIACLNKIINSNYTNVTVVSNNRSIVNNYNSNMLIVNPGSSLGYSHSSNIITNSNFFAYACN